VAERAELSACVFVFDPSGRVLLVRNRDRHDTWEPPGGGGEPGEDPATGALREVWEETGMVTALSGCSGAYFNTAAVRLCVAFIGRAAGDPVPSEETPAVGWFTPVAADAAITRPALRLRFIDTIAVRSGWTAGYAADVPRPFKLGVRLPSAGTIP